MSKKLFTLTEAHIKLLRRFVVDWESSAYLGSPTLQIDLKRPYGNSNIYEDVAEIIGEDPKKLNEDDSGYSIELVKKVEIIHKETCEALQIFLKNAKIKVGDYIADGYSQDWVKK